jgi:hypothetical protein
MIRWPSVLRCTRCQRMMHRYSDARWAAACGTRVTAIRVFQQVGQDLTRTDLPNETAVQFELDNGDSFFLGHGLHDGSDDFAVIHEAGCLRMLR